MSPLFLTRVYITLPSSTRHQTLHDVVLEDVTLNDNPLSVRTYCHVYHSSTVECVFNYTNNGDKDYDILMRSTPLEGLLSEFLTVKRDNERIRYSGVYLRRLEATNDEYLTITSHSLVSVTVDISNAYNMNSPGHYSIVYASPIYYKHTVLLADAASVTVTDQFTPYSSSIVVITGAASDNTVGGLVKAFSHRYNYPCKHIFQGVCAPFFAHYDNVEAKAHETIQIHKTVYVYIDPAIETITQDKRHYKRWFGSRNGRYVKRVEGVFKGIKEVLKKEPFLYYYKGRLCTKKKVLAYTWHKARVIVLCPLHYRTPHVLHPFSQLATVLHEMTHAVGYTVDITYRIRKCLYLAKREPYKAIENAQNYGLYFVTILPTEYGVDSVGSYKQYTYATRGTVYLRYTDRILDCNFPKLIMGRWGEVPGEFYDRFDTLLPLSSGEVIVTNGNKYIQYRSLRLSDDKPTNGSISQLISNLPSDFAKGFDAAVMLSDGKVYITRSSQYIRISKFSLTSKPLKVDAGYPKPLQGHWGKLVNGFDRHLDAIDSSHGHVCLFKGKKFLCYNTAKYSIPNGNVFVRPTKLRLHSGRLHNCRYD